MDRNVNEEKKERLRTLTVELLLELRSAYLGTPGCNVLKHWDQLQSRMLAASRQSESVEEWTTKMVRTLQLGALRVDSSRSSRDLADFVRENNCSRAWLDLIEREFGYLIAMARGIAEQRKEAAQAAREEAAQ
jgi:hypothetical protein